MKLQSDLTGNRKRILEKCYYALKQAETKLINAAIPKSLDFDESSDVPQYISKIYIDCSSISNDLYINNKLCTDWDKL